jgi:hypothetical protein
MSYIDGYNKDILMELIDDKEPFTLVSTINKVWLDYPGVNGKGFIYLAIEFIDDFGGPKRCIAPLFSYEAKLQLKRMNVLDSILD